MRGVSSIELHASNKSQIASQALSYISALYDVEREVKPLSIDERLHIRQARSKPLTDALYQWMMLQQKTRSGPLRLDEKTGYSQAPCGQASVRLQS